MAIKKFELKKAYEDLQLGEKTYRLDLSDAAMQKYVQIPKLLEDFEKNNKKIDAYSATEEQVSERFNQQQQMMKQLIETCLGEEAYDSLFEECGGSHLPLLPVFDYLSGVILQHMNELGLVENEQLKKLKRKVK
ncbi:conserved hypothetical protein [Exiguobacterium sp. 8H]|uniref:hypothetical protein n=1 Tax=unclassified Exiguobacterium TaxID=2644629 RepID=UPI0012F2B660|nr:MULTISPECIES: hypothetical protein [unclassified Exiguobacterium]VXB51537.1 conserved hypothetical protein [Exiguobacterium sp. 8A]VXB52288.1 conserved hypothetical protein [Exiguobacterium sp. 8H]